MKTNFISMRQFSKMAGVSLATTSRVFSNPKAVTDDTLKRVLSLAEEVGFSPSQVSKAAFGQSTKSVGVILSTLNNRYHGAIVRAIQHDLVKAGFLPIFIESSTSPEESITRLLKQKVDGLIIGCSDERLNVPKICIKQMARLPIINLEQVRPGLWSDMILNDDYSGGFQAGKHLIGLGHRHFGACIYGEGHGNSVPRINGFRDALALADCSLNETDITYLPPFKDEAERYEDVRLQLERIMRRSNSPTAFFAVSDFLALQVYEAARNCGKKIPEEISVIGFGNLEFASFLSPPMTTVLQDPETIGHKAVDLFLKRLSDPERGFEEIRIPVKLLERKSTAKAV